MTLIINNVLNFVQSAMDTLDDEKIVEMTVAFYSPECVLAAKNELFHFCGVTPIARRAGKRYPNPTCPDVGDVIDLFRKMTNEDTDVPKYVCEGFGSLPSSDFGAIAGVLCSLKDEVASLRIEIMENRKEREKDVKTIEDANTIKEELADIKLMMLQSASLKNVKAPQEQPVLGSQQTKDVTYSGILLGKPGTFDVRTPFQRNNAFQPEGQRTQMRGTERPNNFRREPRGVVGTKNSSESAGEFGAAKRVTEIYIGRCDHRTTPDGIKQYCKRNKIELKNIEELKTVNPEFKSFKISADYEHEEELMKPDYWLTGLLVRKFYRQRTRRSDVGNSNNFLN